MLMIMKTEKVKEEIIIPQFKCCRRKKKEEILTQQKVEDPFVFQNEKMKFFSETAKELYFDKETL